MPQSVVKDCKQIEIGQRNDLRSRVLNYLVGYKLPTLNRISVEADRGTVILRGSPELLPEAALFELLPPRGWRARAD
jgi:hypothetical protein